MIRHIVLVSVVAVTLISGLSYASGGAVPAATPESQREIEVLVEASYSPAEITIKEGERVKLVSRPCPNPCGYTPYRHVDARTRRPPNLYNKCHQT